MEQKKILCVAKRMPLGDARHLDVFIRTLALANNPCEDRTAPLFMVGRSVHISHHPSKQEQKRKKTSQSLAGKILKNTNKVLGKENEEAEMRRVERVRETRKKNSHKPLALMARYKQLRQSREKKERRKRVEKVAK